MSLLPPPLRGFAPSRRLLRRTAWASGSAMSAGAVVVVLTLAGVHTGAGVVLAVLAIPSLVTAWLIGAALGFDERDWFGLRPGVPGRWPVLITVTAAWIVLLGSYTLDEGTTRMVDGHYIVRRAGCDYPVSRAAYRRQVARTDRMLAAAATSLFGLTLVVAISALVRLDRVDTDPVETLADRPRFVRP